MNKMLNTLTRYAFGYCPKHDKLIYLTRKDARAAAKKLHPREHKNAYVCDVGPERWHFGTVAPARLSGDKTRDELYAA